MIRRLADRTGVAAAEQVVFALKAQEVAHAQLQRHDIRPMIMSARFDRGSLLTRQVLSRIVRQEQEPASD